MTNQPDGAPLDPLAAFRSADPNAPFTDQAMLARKIVKALPEVPALKPLRVALLGSGTLNHFADLLRLRLALEGFRAEFHLAPFGGFRQEILDPNSALYAFQPDIVWLFTTARDVHMEVPHGASAAGCEAAVQSAVSEWQTLWKKLRGLTPGSLIQNNTEAPAVRLFGQHDGGVAWSRVSLVRRFNLEIAGAAAADRVGLFDLDHAAAQFGLSRWHEDRHWHQSKQPFAPDAFGPVAFQAARYIAALKGTTRKCLVLDLDNTLWGGVIGDDGMAGIQLGDSAEGEAFVAFQSYLKTLRGRGILLAVCTKNEEAVAREPFASHPAMQLRLDDIVVFKANWDSKVDNLRAIAATLNIGLDALVFVDDNPAERDVVRRHLPEVTVPEMPSDPADFVSALAGGHYFESASFSSEDSVRTRFYAENARRDSELAQATDLTTFLRDLDMSAQSGPADPMRLPRMAQLLARTNQFHPTTTRHTEAELAAMAADPNVWLRWFSLRDRFGDHGLVSVALMRHEGDAFTIDTWTMSCRVFSRGLEDLVFLEMAQAARRAGATYLIGHFRPTAKNMPVANLYARLGFAEDGTSDGGSQWRLNLHDAESVAAPFIRHEPATAENPRAEQTR